MSFLEWFRITCLYNIFFWWIALIAIFVLSYPLIRWFRLWQSGRRFMESQSARLANPQNADIRFQVAHLYAKGGNWRRALEYMAEAIRVTQENPIFEGQAPYPYLLLWGQSLYHRGKYAEAVDAFQKALGAKAECGYTDAQFGLGKALYRKGDVAKAIDAYRRTLDENQSILEIYFRIAQAASVLGKKAEVASARAEFFRVAAALPSFASRHRRLWRLAFLLFPITRHLA
jgi:tetratricopeptide (TPR) repeat protein